MMNNDMMRAIELGNLEAELLGLDRDIEARLYKNELYMGWIELKYEGDKLLDLDVVEEVRHRMTELLKLINKVCDIEMKAIAYNDHDLMYKCGLQKAKMVSQMELLRNKYDL